MLGVTPVVAWEVQRSWILDPGLEDTVGAGAGKEVARRGAW